MEIPRSISVLRDVFIELSEAGYKAATPFELNDKIRNGETVLSLDTDCHTLDIWLARELQEPCSWIVQIGRNHRGVLTYSLMATFLKDERSELVPVDFGEDRPDGMYTLLERDWNGVEELRLYTGIRRKELTTQFRAWRAKNSN